MLEETMDIHVFAFSQLGEANSDREQWADNPLTKLENWSLNSRIRWHLAEN
jgi:hypothetical protein